MMSGDNLSIVKEKIYGAECPFSVLFCRQQGKDVPVRGFLADIQEVYLVFG